MENFIFYTVIILLLSASALWFYWAAFYPAIILKARFRIIAIQDEVRLAARNDQKLAMTRAYLEFEHFLIIARWASENHHLVGLYYRHPLAAELAEIEKRIDAIFADHELASKFMELTRWMTVIRAVAAPTYLVIMAFLVSLSMFSDWARNLAQKKEKEAFAVGECLPA